MPIPQYEFGFAPDSFNLVVETTSDGERLVRERREKEQMLARAQAAQSRLFEQNGVSEKIALS